MIAKKRLLPILMAVLMVFAMMPMSAGTVFADDIEVPEIRVTLDSGSGSGDSISFTSLNDGRYYGISGNGAGVANGQFYYNWSRFYLRVPDCPESFSGQDGEVFTGWVLNDSGPTYKPGVFIIATGNMKLTATWAADGDASLSSLTVDKGELDPPFSPDETTYNVNVYYNGSPVKVRATATAAQSEATVKYNDVYDSCPDFDDNNPLEILVTNGANEKKYYLSVRTFYSITTEIEGSGSVKTYNAYDQNDPPEETNIAFNRHTFRLVATPSYGWKFKEWQLISGSGTLNNSTSATTTYRINGDNAVVKAIFVPTYTVTFKAAGGTWADGTTDDKEVTVEKGQAAIAPENPTREGFSFSGWNKDFRNITSDLTVTAQWVLVVDGVVYTPNEDGTTATVTGYTEDLPSAVTIREKVGDHQQYTVTGIGNSAFSSCGSLTSIDIPASVTSIGNSAFNGCPFTSINFLGSQNKWNAISGGGKPNIEGASNIFFTNDDGTELQFSIVKSGMTPSYQGATPTKAPDAQYKYAFAGWTPEITAVNGDATYTATYDKTAKISIKDAKVALSATSYTYNANVQKPTIKTIKGLTLKEGTDYIAKWSNASSINAGTYSVTITGQGDYTGTTTATYTINKAANPLTIKAKTATVKFSKLKKKAQPLAVTKVIKFTKQLNDKKTYTLSSAKKGKKSFKKYFKVNKTTGKVTVKKGLEKGTYNVKVKVKALGNTNYKASAVKTVTFKVKVK